MQGKYIRIDTNFLDGEEQVDNNQQQMNNNYQLEQRYHYAFNDSQYIKDQHYSDLIQRKQDQGLMILQNTLNTQILRKIIIGFNAIKRFELLDENALNTGYTNLYKNNSYSNIERGQSYVNLLNQFPIPRIKSTQAKDQNHKKVVTQTHFQQVQGIKQKQTQHVSNRIQKLQNLINNIRKQKQFQSKNIPKQRNKYIESIEELALDSKPPPYIVFFMEQMKSIRKDIHQLKNINESILNQSRSLSIKEKSRSRNRSQSYSQLDKNIQEYTQFKLPINRTSHQNPNSSKFVRNQTERKINNHRQKGNGNLSQRKDAKKLQYSDSLMKIKKISNIKQQYSARIQEFRDNLKAQQHRTSKIVPSIHPQAPTHHQQHSKKQFHAVHNPTIYSPQKKSITPSISRKQFVHVHNINHPIKHNNFHPIINNPHNMRAHPDHNNNKFINTIPSQSYQMQYYHQNRKTSKPVSVAFNGTPYITNSIQRKPFMQNQGYFSHQQNMHYNTNINMNKGGFNIPNQNIRR